MPKPSPSEKCVCCASSLKKVKSQPIFDDYGKFRRIQFLLAECANKFVTEVAGSQQSICTECLNQLDLNYAFKLKCAKATREENEESYETSDDGNSVDESTIPGLTIEHQDAINFKPETYTMQLMDEADKKHLYKTETNEQNIESLDHSESESDLNTNTICTAAEIKDESTSLDGQNDLLIEDETSLEFVDIKGELSDGSLISIEMTDGIEMNEVEYLESIDDSIDSESRFTTRTSFFETRLSFIETLTVHSIKEKIREGIPVHHKPELESAQKPKTHQRSHACTSVVPGLQIKPADYLLDNTDPIDIDDYVMSIVSVSFCEFAPFVVQTLCKLCTDHEVTIESYTFLMQHTLSVHGRTDERLECCLGLCETFDNQTELNNHCFLQHGDIISAYIFLSCQTCEMGTESLVTFGKHVCSVESLPEPPVDNKYTCKQCNTNLVSRKRSIFHQQFHLPTPRPKVCLVCDMVFGDEKHFYEHVMFAHEEFVQFFCRFCDKSFTIKSELRRHEHRHTAVRSYMCCDCDKAFFNPQSLSTHNLIHLPGFNCEYCQKHFNRKSRLRKHMITTHIVHSPTVLKVCDQCGQTFANVEAANQHWTTSHKDVSLTPLISSETSNSVFCCEFCEVAFMDVQKLSEHKITHDDGDDKYECQYCPAKYDAYSRLKTHSNSHAAIKKPFPVKRLYVCEVEDCYKPYSDWRNFQNHRKTVHLINPSVIRCDQCDAVFYKSWSYAYHVKSVHQKHTQCPYCEQTFVLERSLEEHIARKHLKGDDGTTMQNTHSNRNKKYQDLVATYFRTELDGFTCLKCDKLISRRNNAIAHVKMMHLNIKDFQCEVCSKKFFHRGDLNTHIRLHNLEKPYKCPECDHSARSKSMLNMHMRKHTDDRPFQCDECPKSFKRQLVLNNHKALHRPKQFQCNQCEMAFYTKDTFKAHCKSKHETDVCKESVNPKSTKKPTPPSIIIVMYGSSTDPNLPTTPSNPGDPDPPKVYRLKTK